MSNTASPVGPGTKRKEKNGDERGGEVEKEMVEKRRKKRNCGRKSECVSVSRRSRVPANSGMERENQLELIFFLSSKIFTFPNSLSNLHLVALGGAWVTMDIRPCI